MAVTAQWYPRGLKAAMNKEVDWNTDVLRVMLLTNAYTFSAAHDYANDIRTNEVAATGGYVTDGAQITTPTVTDVVDSGLTAHAVSTAYVQGDLVRPAAANGHCYMCIVAGTTAGVAPTWPTTLRATVADNTVTWAEVGPGFTRFDGDNISYTSSTITARYAVVYVDTGVDTTSALLGFVDFGQDESSSSGNFDITWSAEGILRIFGAFSISS